MPEWKAVDEVFPGTRHQRSDACVRRFHKISNVLNKFPKSMGPAVISDLQDINHAETKVAALVAIEVFKETYGIKYRSAADCLTRDSEAPPTFLEFPRNILMFAAKVVLKPIPPVACTWHDVREMRRERGGTGTAVERSLMRGSGTA